MNAPQLITSLPQTAPLSLQPYPLRPPSPWHLNGGIFISPWKNSYTQEILLKPSLDVTPPTDRSAPARQIPTVVTRPQPTYLPGSKSLVLSTSPRRQLAATPNPLLQKVILSRSAQHSPINTQNRSIKLVFSPWPRSPNVLPLSTRLRLRKMDTNRPQRPPRSTLLPPASPQCDRTYAARPNYTIKVLHLLLLARNIGRLQAHF